MSTEVLQEEFEVLESIYASEFSKISDKEINVEVEPEDPIDALALKVTLHVQYPDDYPDVLPELSLDCDEGELEDSETEELIGELKKMGEENLGMAMTFTLVSHLKDRLTDLIQRRADKIKKEEVETERIALEEEAARTRGTPVTVDSFKAWKVKFDAEQAQIRAREEEERMKGLTPKEREEWKRMASRLSGRQLFERNKHLEDENLMEEGTVSVDFDQYDRRQRDDEGEDEDHVTFSDSD